MLDVLQHRKGEFSARSTRDQPRRADTLVSSSGIHDPRPVGGVSLREGAGSRASPTVWIRRLNAGTGEATSWGSLKILPVSKEGIPVFGRCSVTEEFRYV